MKLIIDISEEYKRIIKGNWLGESMAEIFENGTPLEDIKAEIPILSHWQTDDGQDLLMVADALECIDNQTGKGVKDHESI